MSDLFTPTNWYWLADDGRVFASARQVVVDESDPDYAEWIAGNIATQWPRDLDGAQTDASIQEVLEQYNMFVSLTYYTVNARWRKEQGGMTATAGFPVNTDDRSQAKITGLYAASREVPSVVTPYSAADHTVHQLDAAGMYALNQDLLTHINNAFSVSADMIAGIDGGTITTRQQIDDAFAAPMTQARKDWMKG